MVTATVTVASKLSFPLTLTVSQGKWEDATDERGRPTKIFVPGGEMTSFTVRGFGAQRRLESNGHVTGETNHVVGDYGLTPNIPQDFWNQWLAENNRPGAAAYPMIKNGLIFAHSRPSMATAQAKEQAETWSGTEALIPQTFDRSGHRTSRRDPRVAPEIATLDHKDGL
jgi:hypothetical protein